MKRLRIFISVTLTFFTSLLNAQSYNTWEHLPIYGMIVRVGDISPVHPDSLLIFYWNNGYYTTDGGLNWNPAEGSFSAVYNVFFHPQYADSIFINDLYGVRLSGDFGKNWEFRSYPQNASITDLAIYFPNTRYMYGISNGGSSVYVSNDQGNTWVTRTIGSNVSLKSIEVSQQNPQTIFVTTSDSIYKSLDGGQTWINITGNYYDFPGSSNGFDFYIRVSPYDDQLLVVYKGWYTNSVAISYDQGNSWQNFSVIQSQYVGFNQVRFLPDDQTIFLTARKSTVDGGIYKSTDRGATWSKLPTNGLMNTNVVDVLINQKNPDILYALTNGNGVFKTIDGGNNWLPYNQNIYDVGIVDVAESPTNPDIIIAGSVNGGVFRSLNGGSSWAPVNIGLGDLNIQQIIWPANQPDKILLLTEDDGLYISENNGSSWEHRPSSNMFNYEGMAYDSVSQRIYVAGNAYYEHSPVIYTDDWGQTWQEIPVPTDFPGYAFGVAYNYMNNSVYLGTLGELYKYDGSSWVNLSGTFFTNENQYPGEIYFYPNSIDTLYVVSDAGGVVYRGVNGGTSWSRVYPYGGNNVFIDQLNPAIHYIIGFTRLKSFDYGHTWISFNEQNSIRVVGSFGGEPSRHNRNLIYFRTSEGLYRLIQAPEADISSPAGSQTLVGKSDTLRIIITNNGNTELQLSSANLTGSHVQHWQVVSNLPRSLIIDEKDTLLAIFKPDSVGDLSATLNIQTNDPVQPTVSVSLNGTGMGGAFSIPITAVNFGEVGIDSSSQSNLSLLNNGNMAITVTQVSLSGTDAAAFSVSNHALPFNVEPGDSLPLTISFSPTEIKTYQATLSIASTDVYNPQIQVTLSGTGVKNTGTISVSVDSLQFGTVLVDSTSSVKWITVQNTSTDYPLRIDSLRITPDVFALQFSEPLPYTLPPQQEVKIGVTFTPVDEAAYTGTLTIFTNAINADQWTIPLTGTGRYPEPPQVQFNPGTISATKGNQAKIAVTIQSDLPLTYARLFYHKGGDVQYDSTEMNSTDGATYSATIPASALTERGVAYYFKISDGQHTVRYPQTGAINLSVSVQNLESSIVNTGQYQMISIPMRLADPSPLSVLGDNLGEYNANNWRLFRWINGEYVELSDKNSNVGSFEPGIAFWLATKTANSFNTGAGTSTPVADSFVVELQEGWNQIATPYAFAVSWASVKKEGNVASDLWAFDVDGQQYKAATVLEPWSGYFVKALGANARLVFYPVADNGSQVNAATPEAGEWRIRIEAVAGKTADKDNFAGVSETAQPEYDPLDWFDPPPVGDYVNVFFDHPDWKIKGRFSRDIRPKNTRGETWTFTVETNKPNAPVQLNFSVLGQLRSDVQIWIWDETLNIPVNIQEQPTYRFDFRDGERQRTFQLIAGTAEFVQEEMGHLNALPREITLYPNFPNPFNPETAIKFALPAEETVWLTIYNVAGQTVRTLIDGQKFSPGYHAVLWRGQNDRGMPVPSGIYFGVLRTSNAVHTIKMMLVR